MEFGRGTKGPHRAGSVLIRVPAEDCTLNGSDSQQIRTSLQSLPPPPLAAWKRKRKPHTPPSPLLITHNTPHHTETWYGEVRIGWGSRVEGMNRQCCQALLLDSVVISERGRERNKQEVYWRCFIWKGIKVRGT